MAAAAQLQLISEPSIMIPHAVPNVISSSSVPSTTGDEVNMDLAIHYVHLFKQALNDLHAHLPNFDHTHGYTADEIIALPLDKHRVSDELHDLPRRKSGRHSLAVAISSLLYPVHEGSLASIIRYEADKVRVRAWIALQRKWDILDATRRNGHTSFGMTGGAAPGVQAPVWAARITAQGAWDPIKQPISLGGVQAIPMPVEVANEADLAPFLGHLENGGTFELDGNEQGFELDKSCSEPYYGVRGAEFRKGVVYEDGRMDLCKMVVGPDHIGKLMDSLRPNSFVKHFLLGNNIIGPVGACEVANFINEFPGRMDTWYLAGNCIDGAGFRILVDAMIQSEAVTNIWLKRNPLGADASGDVFRLITGAKNLRTLDLDQTELGNHGVADLFTRLAAHQMPEGKKLLLEIIYLNGNGISTEGARAIGEFLMSPHCGLTSIYMAGNPLGNEGVDVLAPALAKAPYLVRLSLQSVGVSTKGAIALCMAMTGHPMLESLDIGQAYSTHDLGYAYNYIEDGAIPHIIELITTKSRLAHINFGHCPITPPGLRAIDDAVLKSPTLLFFGAFSILPDPTILAATFKPSVDTRLMNPADQTRPQILMDKAVREHLTSNVQARYGNDMSYTQFMEGERRWLTSDRVDVRKIDSVYRNRDAGLARRRLLTLVKNWKEDDETLDRVMNAHAPSCSVRRRGKE